MMAICIYSKMLWRVIRWIANNCKVSLPCKLTESPKNISTAFQPCHKRTSWHHVSDSLVNTGVSVDEDNAGDHSVMLSLNNRLEASKGGWCLESLFFLCQPWLPARKHMPSSLLYTKKGFTGMDIVASKIAPKSTIYRIIKKLQGERFNCCEEGFRAPKKVQQVS